MKRQSYEGQTGIAGFDTMVINTLVTNFKKTLGKPLKNFPARTKTGGAERKGRRPYFFLAPPFLPALACAAACAAASA
jgi:hypothetical protein